MRLQLFCELDDRKNRVDVVFLLAYIGVMENKQQPQDYKRIEQALVYLEVHRAEQPSLEDVADHVGLSPFHFQRLFSRWVGVSPKRFLQFLTIGHARQCLGETRSVLDAAFDAGLSSPGRLHDLMIAVDAVSPGEYRTGGAGLIIRYGFETSPFGPCLIGVTDRGVCWLSFHDEVNGSQGLDELRRSFSNAVLVEDRDEIAGCRDRIFDRSRGAENAPLPVLLAGTNFQLKVWEALLSVPDGAAVTYGDLAQAIGKPKAARAVGNAVGANPIAWIIPCHRVIRETGLLGGYRWGEDRKVAMRIWEEVRRSG